MSSMTVYALVVVALVSAASGALVPQPVYSRFRSQDELGGYHFGYSGGPTSRAEHRDHNGVVRGAYNWVDGDGKVYKFEYISDALGYRLVSGTGIPEAPVHVYNLPAAPVVQVAPLPVAPVPVEETPEVKQARAEFEAAFRKAVDAVTV